LITIVDTEIKGYIQEGKKPVAGCSTSCLTTITPKNLVMNRTRLLRKRKCLKTITLRDGRFFWT